MSRASIFAVLAALVSVSTAFEYNYYPATENTWQKDTVAHTVVAIQTTYPLHECSNYCTMRGKSFGCVP